MNWAALARTGLHIASIVVPQIGLIEQIANVVPALRGPAKEDAAVALTKAALEGAEIAQGKELLSDPEFETAVRSLIRSYVAVQNVVNAKPAATQS